MLSICIVANVTVEPNGAKLTVKSPVEPRGLKLRATDQAAVFDDALHCHLRLKQASTGHTFQPRWC